MGIFLLLLFGPLKRRQIFATESYWILKSILSNPNLSPNQNHFDISSFFHHQNERVDLHPIPQTFVFLVDEVGGFPPPSPHIFLEFLSFKKNK
jgi:hypothetical protein